MITLATVDRPIFTFFFTVKFRKDLCRKVELKLPPPLNLWPHYLAKHKWSTYTFTFILARIICSVRQHLFPEFLFVYLSFIPDTDVIMTLVQYFLCCITHSFQLWRKMFGIALNNAQLTHPLTSGIHDSKHAYVPKADILNTWRKLISVDQQRNNILREHLPQLNVFSSLWTELTVL